MEEKFLVKKAKRGDVDAFGELYATCYKKLYQYALYTLQNKEDAEDVVGETVMDAFASIGKLRNDESFQSWIKTILVNKCKQKRKEYLHKGVELTEELQESDDYDKAEENYRNHSCVEDTLEIQHCLMQLPEMERTIISMNVILGFTMREIAQITNTNENTIRSKKSRALEKLRECLADELT